MLLPMVFQESLIKTRKATCGSRRLICWEEEVQWEEDGIKVGNGDIYGQNILYVCMKV